MHTRAVNRLRLEAELREAMGKNQFRVYYEPIVELRSKRIAGFEALLRWQHPEQGLISPAKFLDAAEDTGLLVSIGQWLLSEACRQLIQWTGMLRFASDLRLLVNVSAKQLAHPGLVDDVRAGIQQTKIKPGRLVLQIDESVAVADPKRTAHVLSQLRSIGVNFVLSHFGAGESSLRQLRDFPLEAVKFDQSLTRGMLSDRNSGDMVELILLVAHKLNLRVIAEGIETAIQLERVRHLGCEFGQGHLFAQPLDSEEAQKMLLQERGAISASERPTREVSEGAEQDARIPPRARS